MSKLDYDFSNADKDKAMSYGVIARTIVLDEMVGRHIKEKSIEGSNAKFTWGVKNGKLLQKLVPAFSYKEEVSLIEGMKKMMPIYHVIGKIPGAKKFSNNIIVLEKK